ncbi:MAG TPA: hypothetical protein VEK73_16290 [Xanthobacteraceae bacterium]|nr:hypothetical protein [Xanthobacteraceae bacterium]
MSTGKDDQYSEQETQQRITAAVRGARIVGHKPMKGNPKSAKRTARKRILRRKITD